MHTDSHVSRTMTPQGRERERTIFKVTFWGAVANVVLSAFKIAAGTFGHSHAVLADGFHSLSDLATDIAILIGSRYWSRPPDISHPHGHRRIETIISFAIGLTLAGVAVGIGWSSISTLRTGDKEAPGMIALVAALASIVIKEGLFRWTVLTAHRVKSPAMEANAWHHRSDALSSIPAAAAVAVAAWLPKFAFLDAVGGIVVSLFILHAAGKILLPVVSELADAGAPEGTIERIGAIVLAIDGVHGVHHIRTRYLGSRLAVDLHLLLDDNLPLVEAHRIGDTVALQLKQQEPVIVDVITHLEPLEAHEDEISTDW
ncbi:MAG: cation diffusion facilitator family transporter [bacterium]